MTHAIVVIPGPLVGAAGLVPLADALRGAGHRVQLPDVLGAHGGMPRWPDWPGHLQRLLAQSEPVVLVGYSAASTLAAALATQVPTRGVVFLDGDIPPERGPAQPGSPALRALLRPLVGADGRLPRWSDCWRTPEHRAKLGLTALEADAAAYAAFQRAEPTCTLSWFDDTIDVAPWRDWPAAFVQTSPFFATAADEAERRGWPTVRVNGTHLHPVLAPSATARAIVTVCDSWSDAEAR